MPPPANDEKAEADGEAEKVEGEGKKAEEGGDKKSEDGGEAAKAEKTKKVGRKVLATASGKSVVQVPVGAGHFRTVVVKKASEHGTSRVSIENGMIVQRKIVVGPDGKRRLVTRRTAASRKNAEDDEDEDAEDVNDEEEKAALAKKKNDPLQMEIVRQGFLKRQFGKNRAWIKMWLVLRGHWLFFYQDQASTEIKMKFNLTGLRVLPISEKRAQMKYVFQIFHPMKLQIENILFLQGSDQEDYDEWIEAFEKSMGIGKAKAMAVKKPTADAEKLRERMLARQKLAQDASILKREFDAKHYRYISAFCLFVCNNNGLTTPDLLSFDPILAKRASERWNVLYFEWVEGKDLNIDPETDDVRTILVILRIFLIKEIDYPVLTFGQYEEFVSSYHKYLALDRVGRYQKLIEILPPFNRDCVKRLLEFFCYMSFNSDKNDSTLASIVQAFAPAILRPIKTTQDTDMIAKVVAFLIRRAYLLFPITERDVDDIYGDDNSVRLALRQEARFSDDVQLPGTGVGTVNLAHIGTGKTIESVDVYKNQVTESCQKFSREIGTQGYFLLIDRKIDVLQAQIDRLPLAEEEIKKFSELDEEVQGVTDDVDALRATHQEFQSDLKSKLANKKK